MSMRLISGAALLALAAATLAPAAVTKGPPAANPAPIAKPEMGAYGFDVSGMDRAVAPGDNFYEYANGGWMARTQIPQDRASYGMFHKLDDLSRERTHAILDEAAKTPGSKIGDFYASYLDEAAADAKGAAPLKPWMAEIAAAGTKSQLAAELGKLTRQGVKAPFKFDVNPDDKQPDVYIIGLEQGGLGMPDRDYYLKPDPQLAETRAKYVAYLAQLLTLAGEKDAMPRAQAVMRFETAIATAHWDQIASRDADKTYNKWAIGDFAQKAPGFDWSAYFDGSGMNGSAKMGARAMLVAQPSAFAGEAKAFADTPLPVLKDYAMVRLLNAYAPYLSKPFIDAWFGFTGTALSGQPEIKARWKRGVDLVSAQMGEAIGPAYVARYFPPAAKASADALVRNIIASMDMHLQNVSWMAPETKVKARAKLTAFHAKIGYPDSWRDYSTLVVKRDDLVGNVARGNAFEFQRKLDKLGRPIDRGEWDMTPMTINAYANPVMDEIVFPAAILQPPFFDPNADPAVNYGGIGVVIGHEISHHFDDQGRKYDATGKLTDWWTPQDVSRFTALTDRLVKQYDAYEPLPGQHVQGGLTLGENMADLAGLTIAYDAWKLSLGGKPAPVIDGMTGDQRFYLGFAQVWRTKYREAVLRQQLLSDPHSPGEQRVDEVRNVDPWYAAFGAKPGDKLYLAPADRVRVW